jgi:glycerophosphoryl diester phosphodiesterase
MAGKGSIAAAAVVAHRGGSLEAPENTLTAVRHAIALGVAAIEIDVQSTRDGLVMLFHDDRLSKKFAGRAGLRFRDLDSSVCRTLDVCAGRPEAPPLLADVLELLAKTSIELMIEVKGDAGDEELVDRVAALLAAIPPRSPRIVGSLIADLVHRLHRRAPEERIVAIVDAEADIESFKGPPIDTYAVDHRLARPEYVADRHAEGARVWTWTVNDIDRARGLLADGVDAVITDAPGRFLAG